MQPVNLEEKYTILRPLGQGGQATTSLALDNTSQQQVVIKQLHMAHIDNWKAVELFEREGRILSHLDHPQIPSYIDAFHVQHNNAQQFVIIQEFVEGHTLKQLIDDQHRFSEDDVKRLLNDVFSILHYLHTLSPPVIHRDIKPANLIQRPDGSWCLIDFGAIQAVLSESSKVGSTIVGTSGYMSPEQFMGHAVPATDLYALGATAIHMLSHIHPSELPLSRMKLNFKDKLNCSNALKNLLEHMIEPNVEDRLPSAEAGIHTLANLNYPLQTQHTQETTSSPQTSAAKPVILMMLTAVAVVAAGATVAFVTQRQADTKPPYHDSKPPIDHVITPIDHDDHNTSTPTDTPEPTRYVSPFDKSKEAQRALFKSLSWELVSDDTRLDPSQLSLGDHTLHVSGLMDTFHVGLSLTNHADTAIKELHADIKLLDKDNAVIKGYSTPIQQTFQPPALPNDRMHFDVEIPQTDNLKTVQIHLTSPSLIPIPSYKKPYKTVPLQWLSPPGKNCSLKAVARDDSFKPTYQGAKTYQHHLKLAVENDGSCPFQLVLIEKRLLDKDGNVISKNKSYLNATYDPVLEPEQHLLVSLDSYNAPKFASYTLHVLKADVKN